MVTISNAVRLLEKDGFVKRLNRQGTFVRKIPIISDKDKFKKVGLVMPIKGDLYQNIAEVLLNALEEFDYEKIPLGSRLNDYQTSLEMKEIYIKKYIKRGFDFLIINGERHFNYKVLHKYKGYFKQLNFIINNESALEFPEANTIEADYEKAGYLGGKHLIEKGRRRIVFTTYEKLSPEQHKSWGVRQFTSDMQILSGIKSAMTEAGIEPDVHTIRFSLSDLHPEKYKMKIKDFMKQGNCGIMVQGDVRAQGAYNAASELGLALGKDCSMVGLFNTPWTGIFKPGLTSISINEREIGCLAAQAIVKGWKGKKIKVEPELIVRDT